MSRSADVARKCVVLKYLFFDLCSMRDGGELSHGTKFGTFQDFFRPVNLGVLQLRTYPRRESFGS